MFSLHPVNINAIDATNPYTDTAIHLLNIIYYSNIPLGYGLVSSRFWDETRPRFFAPHPSEYSKEKNVAISKSPIF
jgi:hypothetical protein